MKKIHQGLLLESRPARFIHNVNGVQILYWTSIIIFRYFCQTWLWIVNKCINQNGWYEIWVSGRDDKSRGHTLQYLGAQPILLATQLLDLPIQLVREQSLRLGRESLLSVLFFYLTLHFLSDSWNASCPDFLLCHVHPELPNLHHDVHLIVIGQKVLYPQ